MGIIAWFRLHSAENRKLRKDLREIKNLPEDRRIERLGSFFHHFCVENAARFAHEELIARQSDSPFAGIDRGRLFHELLVLNYWLFDRIIADKGKMLLNEMQKQYLVSFHHLSGAADANDLAHFSERFRAFEDTWDDLTGHQDIFGQKVAEHIFESTQIQREREVQFRIILHAHENMKKLRDIRQICRELGIRTKLSASASRCAS